MSLVELMIAMTISLLLFSAVASIFVSTSKARNEIERSSRQIENGRYAAEILSDDLRLAGFYGELNVGTIDTSATTLPASPCSVTVADWIAAIPVHVQGYSNVSAAPSGCTMTNLKAGTDIVVVRRVRTCVAGLVAGCDAAVDGKPYFQVSQCNTEAVATPYVLGLKGTATFSLKTKGATLTTCGSTAGLRQYYVNIYYISTDNGAGVSVPTLTRLELTGAGWTVTPLVEGIEQLHLEYGIDNAPTLRDGAPDVYTSNPSAYPDSTCDDACQVSNWMNVVAVHFFVLARNIDASPGYSDDKAYQLGSLAVPAAGDGYRRHVYSGLVRIANPAGRKDTP